MDANDLSENSSRDVIVTAFTGEAQGDDDVSELDRSSCDEASGSEADSDDQDTPTPPRSQTMYRANSPRTGTMRTGFTYEDEDVTEMNAREQELLVGIQELQRQLSMVQIQTEKPQEEILPPATDSRRRLIMVSNRLPISFQKNETTGEWSFKMSSGGLVTALNGIRDEVPFIWIGWLGEEIAQEDQNKVREKLAKEFNCVPVFLSKEIAERYYNDFSNDILWPTFHYVPLPLFKAGSEKKFDFRLWDAYKLANKRFAQAVNQVYRDGDYVWIHDYHLMNLPALLRKRHPRCKIGWFLHTPFPSSEMYRTLPVGKQILEGLLGADLLGFHTYDYARHFLSACSRIPGATTSPKGIEWEDHFSSVGVFPIGIDPEHFEGILEKPETQTRIKDLCEKFAGCKIIIGVDRMDYIKGIPHRMLAMERFLSKYPERRESVVLIQIAVPSRTGVEEYQQLAASVNEMVGRINGRFGTLQHTPVHYIHQSVTPTELVALYNVADVCLVTSLRDGMNLVSYEYVMCQSKPCEGRREGPGVLILSEFAGSAQSLSGAIRVNPWNNTDMANALEYALTLPAIEREYRQSNLHRYVKTHTASFWGKSFLTELEFAVSRPSLTKKLVKLPTMDVINAYNRSKKRIIVLDYEGTLLDESHQRSTIAPPKAVVKRIIENLAADKKNTVLLVSGHDRSVIGSWLNDKRIGIVAESGYCYRLPHEDEWETMAEDMDPSWKRVVRPIMQYFTERTPGSRIETKESSLTWHYGETDPIFGPMQARDMQINLEDVLCNLPLEILQGTNRVEVRLQGITKTVIIEEVLKQFYHAQSPANTPSSRATSPPSRLKKPQQEKQQVDFVFCAGNGLEDDDLFTFFKEHQELAKKASQSAVPPAPASAASTTPSGLPPLPPPPPLEFTGSSAIMSSALSNKANVFTCHIGANKTEAMYYLERPSDLLRVLRAMSAHSREGFMGHEDASAAMDPLVTAIPATGPAAGSSSST
uniref:alpha,alpha-trehalose-phosphate synthase (UDP-forming) n=1 Tax=Globisporangium ultimum (strain ATCC 200006 / CBS 805.95 / DAOM BR144) TaxID=431595 RepID=K3W821_GLOUD